MMSSGSTRRMLSIGMSDWPPARSRALSRRPSKPITSAVVCGSWYLNGGGFIRSLLWLRHGSRFGRIGDLDHQVLDGLRRAPVARDRVERPGRLVERLSRPQPLQRTVVDPDLVGPLQHVAEGMAARVPVRCAAGAGVALGAA